ncbi:MAG: hypothetical protein WKF84_26840 [Pyrinomonadaceae bacterium]
MGVNVRTIQMAAQTEDASPLYDERPWGTFTVLDQGSNYKVKRIEVLSQKLAQLPKARPAG